MRIRKIYALVLLASIISLHAAAQDSTALNYEERARIDSLVRGYNDQARKVDKEQAVENDKRTNSENLSELKSEKKETKAKAKAAQRVERDANEAARESRMAYRAEKKAQKSRNQADKQAKKAAKARIKSDKN